VIIKFNIFNMITKFKIFESIEDEKRIYIDPSGNVFRNLTKMLCIDNHIGQLENKYNFTVGKIYDIKNFKPYYISFIDDNGIEQYFSPPVEVYNNFSTEQSLEEYEMKKTANKYNL
jgi:hypothetical protein